MAIVEILEDVSNRLNFARNKLTDVKKWNLRKMRDLEASINTTRVNDLKYNTHAFVRRRAGKLKELVNSADSELIQPAHRICRVLRDVQAAAYTQATQPTFQHEVDLGTTALQYLNIINHYTSSERKTRVLGRIISKYQFPVLLQAITSATYLAEQDAYERKKTFSASNSEPNTTQEIIIQQPKKPKIKTLLFSRLRF